MRKKGLNTHPRVYITVKTERDQSPKQRAQALAALPF